MFYVNNLIHFYISKLDNILAKIHIDMNKKVYKKHGNDSQKQRYITNIYVPIINIICPTTEPVVTQGTSGRNKTQRLCFRFLLGEMKYLIFSFRRSGKARR